MIQVFRQNLEAIQGGKFVFSSRFIEWLRGFVRDFNYSRIREFDADLSSAPATSGSFIIDDPDIKAADRIVIVQAPGPYVGKGSDVDECEMDAVIVRAKAGAGTATAYWSSTTPVVGSFKFHYVVS